jgi:hypothetical protein
MGKLLAGMDIFISTVAVFVFASAYICGAILYPLKENRRSDKKPSSFYLKQKSCDLLLAASTFCMIVYIGNNPESLFQQYSSLNATAVVTKPATLKDSSSKNYKSISDFNKSMEDENGNMLKWKERRKLLKQQVKEIKKANDPSKGEKVLLVILSILVALGLLYLIAALSCSIACSGSEAIALLVAIGGTVGVIFLLIFVIRAIYGKKRKKKEAAPQN